MGLIVQGPEVVEWVLERAGGTPNFTMTGLGYVRDKQLVAGFAFEGWTGINIIAHQRQEQMAPRKFWRAVADYCFVTLGCKRVTGPVPASNKKAQTLNKHIGFELEATMKEAAQDGSDLLLFVLWRDKCQQLKW